jgi:hypothetical protein
MRVATLSRPGMPAKWAVITLMVPAGFVVIASRIKKPHG